MFDISLLYELKKGNREAFNGVFPLLLSPDDGLCCFYG